MTESPEYKTFHRHRDDLVTALRSSVASVRDELVALDLVPPDAIDDRRTDDKQARQLVTIMVDRVKILCTRYHDIMKILSKHGWLEDVVEKLHTTYRKDYYQLEIQAH